MNNRRINLEMFSQCRNASSDSKNRKNSVPSMIAHLLNLCRPSAIAGFVISVYIFALNAKCWGAFSHIRVKAFKRIQPWLANRYAATAVIFVVAGIGIGATLDHSMPNVPSSSFGKSMSPVAHGNKMIRRASARFCVLGAQFGAGYEHDISAHTTAPPHCNFATAWSSMGWSLANHSELCEWQSSEINKSVSHNSIPCSVGVMAKTACGQFGGGKCVVKIPSIGILLGESKAQYSLGSFAGLSLARSVDIYFERSIQSRNEEKDGEGAQGFVLGFLLGRHYVSIMHGIWSLNFNAVTSGGCPASTGTRCVYYAQSANISNKIS